MERINSMVKSWQQAWPDRLPGMHTKQIQLGGGGGGLGGITLHEMENSVLIWSTAGSPHQPELLLKRSCILLWYDGKLGHPGIMLYAGETPKTVAGGKWQGKAPRGAIIICLQESTKKCIFESRKSV